MVGWGGLGTHLAIRTQPRPDARRLPASTATHRPLSLRAQPDLSFRPAPRLTSPRVSLILASPRACLSTTRSICLSPRRSPSLSTVLLLFHTRQSPTRAVGHKSLSSRIPLDTGVLIRIRREEGQDDGLACRLLWFPEWRRGLDP